MMRVRSRIIFPVIFSSWIFSRHFEGCGRGTVIALADRGLGLIKEGREAARKAVELNRFDSANQALLAQLEAAQP